MTEQETASLFLGAGEPPEQIEMLLDSIHDLVQSVRLDGSLAYVNRAWRETLGYSAAAIDRMKVFEIIHPTSREHCQEVFARLASGEAVPPFETTFVTADGRPVQLEGNAAVSFDAGRPVLIRVVLRDVSERKLIERRLRASDERFRKLVEESSDGIFLADSLGRISYSSPSLKRVLGFSPAELLGSSGFDLLHPDDLVAAQEYFGRVLAQPGLHLTLRCRARHKGGGWRDLDVVCTNHLNDSAVEGIIVNFRDVTERLQFEKVLQESENRKATSLDAARRLESLGVLAGGIAHDFNNLLTVILGNAELVRRHVPAESQAIQLLASLETAGRRAAELTREMLAYAGRAPLVREPCNLSSVVREMSQLLSTVVPESTPFELALGYEPVYIDGDPAQIRQVVMNLMTNAAESYGDRPGPIPVRTSIVSTTAEFMQSPFVTPAPPPGLYACLEVIDAGCGMAAETVARMFEPFFTTKFIGRGLGLAATLGIVRGHRGTIHVTSSLGVGTTIRVLFPRPADSAKRDVPPPVRGNLDGFGRLLLVDDEEAVRGVATDMLTGAGFEVLTASDGEAAVELLRAEPREVRVILLDVTLPVPGLDALAAIRRVRAGVPVVVMSGHTIEDVSLAYPDQPWTGFVQKPFTLSDLLRAVRGVLEPAE